jgi:hypothetical protein
MGFDRKPKIVLFQRIFVEIAWQQFRLSQFGYRQFCKIIPELINYITEAFFCTLGKTLI